MVSILSGSAGAGGPGHALTHAKNNTIQLVRAGTGNGLSSLVHNTTIYGEENFVENGEIEELHYLMVRVEKMKKAMLGRVECSQLQTAPTLDIKGNSAAKKDNMAASSGEKNKGGAQTAIKLSDEDLREEMLYRSTDYRFHDNASSTLAG